MATPSARFSVVEVHTMQTIKFAVWDAQERCEVGCLHGRRMDAQQVLDGMLAGRSEPIPGSWCAECGESWFYATWDQDLHCMAEPRGHRPFHHPKDVTVFTAI
jgi:hypothetical protein